MAHPRVQTCTLTGLAKTSFPRRAPKAIYAATTPVATGSSRSSSVTGGTASASCTFTSTSDAKTGKTTCTTIVPGGIAMDAGVTLDVAGLKSGTSIFILVIFQGKTSWTFEEWSGPLFSVSGEDIKRESNSGSTKPKFFYAHNLTDTSSISNLNILIYPIQCFSISKASGLTISNVSIDNSAAGSLGHNTDAFDVGSSTNLDGCLAINSGSGITSTGGKCSGGYGLSIGSVYSTNGVRIKTVSGATGSVKGVTFKAIKPSGTKLLITDYGIVIEQDDENGSPTGTPTGGVPITGLTVSGVTGTIASDATNIYILCAACSGWTRTDLAITGGTKSSRRTGSPNGVSC
ncbi:putative extracellular polygalacturonase [Rhexocercosporidium sp. MPI-PUGE-AT-0058]|nr:putative extracellular polygalacturonase [Rhexocercosporidium sp. MPI-PUGE-AT-0058]